MSGRDRIMDDQTLDALLGEWLSEGAQAAPDRIAEKAMLEVATTPQEGTRLTQLWTSMTATPHAWAAAVVIALALGIGLFLTFRFIAEPSPSPTPTPGASASPSPEASAGPSDASFHRSDTPVGTIEWTRVESDRRFFPWGEVDGLIVGYEVDDNFETLGWYTSEDGITWTEASPFIAAYPGGTVDAGDDVLSFESPDSYSVSMGPISHRQVIDRDWFDNPGDWVVNRRDGESWVPIPVPPAEPTVPSGLRLNGSRFGGAAALDEANWVAPLITFVDIDWLSVLGLDLEDALPIWNEEAQRLEIFAPGQDPFGAGQEAASLAVSLATGGAPTIQFRDEGGALVHEVPATLPGWTSEELLRSLRGWGLDDVNFLVSRNGEISVIRPPWPMGEDWTAEVVTSALGRYFTVSGPLGENFSLSGFRLWESIDGLTWSQVEVPPLVDGALNNVSLAGTDDQLLMTISAEAGDSLWVSTDGRNWMQSNIDSAIVTLGAPEATDFGWLLNAFDAAAVSADGLAWELINLPLLDAEPSTTYVDGLFMYGPEAGVGGAGRWHTWIGTFQD